MFVDMSGHARRIDHGLDAPAKSQSGFGLRIPNGLQDFENVLR